MIVIIVLIFVIMLYSIVKFVRKVLIPNVNKSSPALQVALNLLTVGVLIVITFFN